MLRELGSEAVNTNLIIYKKIRWNGEFWKSLEYEKLIIVTAVKRTMARTEALTEHATANFHIKYDRTGFKHFQTSNILQVPIPVMHFGKMLLIFLYATVNPNILLNN